MNMQLRYTEDSRGLVFQDMDSTANEIVKRIC
jgi:hypothetical protein